MTKYKKYLILPVLFACIGLFAGACSSGPKEDSAQGATQKVTEEYSKAAVEAVPYPLEEMKDGGWLERMNLRERLIRYSDSSKISYIYLFSDQGQLMANYTVKGKVSNASSQMTTAQTVDDYCGSGNYCPMAIDAPMDDGTWGPSEDAIFFYTTDGVMIQTPWNYILSDAPLDLTTQPLLVYNTGSEPSSVADEKNYGG